MKRLRRSKSAPAPARRAKVILLCAEGRTNGEISALTGLLPRTVEVWRRRFLASGMEGLADRPRTGAPRRLTGQKVAEVIRLTLETTTEDGAPWSTRRMAIRCGISNERVARIWQASGIRPGVSGVAQRPRKISPMARGRDFLGLYLSPRRAVLVLSSAQAGRETSRNALALPGESNEYQELKLKSDADGARQNWLEDLDRQVSAACASCSGTEAEGEFDLFLRDLGRLAARFPKSAVVVDRSLTEEIAVVGACVPSRGCWRAYAISGRASWLRSATNFFSRLERKGEGRNARLAALVSSVRAYLRDQDGGGGPFVWTASEGLILSSKDDIDLSNAKRPLKKIPCFGEKFVDSVPASTT